MKLKRQCGDCFHFAPQTDGYKGMCEALPPNPQVLVLPGGVAGIEVKVAAAEREVDATRGQCIHFTEKFQ